jgi:AraC-like DNA-binding protein/quercetin dioxygenase-like cupin family protein
MPYNQYYLEKHSSHILKSTDSFLYTGIVSDIENWGSEEQSHDFCELLYICDGAGTVYINDHAYPVRPGDVVVYNSGSVHCESTGKDDPFRFLFLAFRNLITKDLPPDHLVSSDSSPVFPAGEAKYRLESLFTELINETRSHVFLHEIMCENILASIIILIMRIQRSQSLICESSNSECEIIKNYIDSNYSENITLGSLSDLVYISKHHLAHIFKKEVGVAPINYLIMRRMEEAKMMLRDTELSINEIASKLGYENTSYFSQIFKKYMDFSPLHYRQQQLKDRQT